MSYATYKECYEMSSTNIAKYVKSLKTVNFLKDTPKQSAYNNGSGCTKSLSAKNVRFSSKYIGKNNPKLCLSEADVNRNQIKKKATINKNSFNSECKRSKLMRNLEKEDLSLLTKESALSQSNENNEECVVVVKVPHLFACNICTDSFVSQNTLDIHLKYDHRPRPTCSQCGKMFECRRKLINHEANCASVDSPAPQSLCGIIDFISPVEVFFCVKCENPFLSKDVLREHKILLNKRKPLSIEFEDLPVVEFPQNANYEICVKKIPSYSITSDFDDDDYNKCGYCGKFFQNIRRFKQHSAFCREMKAILKARECYYCKKSFNSSILRDRHTPFCTKRTCGYSYILSDKYLCEICNIHIESLNDFNLHLHLDHDYRYCCKCDEMYLPDTTHGIKHTCKVKYTRIISPPYESYYKSYPKRTDKLNKTLLKGKKKKNKIPRRGGVLLDQTNVKERPLVVFEKKLKENIPLGTNKIVQLNEQPPINQIDTSIRSKYEQRPPRINKGKNKYSRARPYNHKNNGMFHCIFCPNRSFVHRCGLDSHLRGSHYKEQCKTCGDIYMCNESSQHNCTVIKVEPVEDNMNSDQVSLIEQTSSDPNLLGSTELVEPDEISVEVDSDFLEAEPIPEHHSEPVNAPTTTTPQQFQCYKCSKTYAQKQNIVKHLIVHSKRHPFKCKYCRKLFKSPVSVVDHTRTVHHPFTYTHRKPLTYSLIERHQIKECHICNNLFLGIADLKQHQKKFHDFAVLSNNERSMCSSMSMSFSVSAECHICHKNSKSTKLLKSKDNEVLCEDCSDAFSRDCFQTFNENKVDKTSSMFTMLHGEHFCSACSKNFDSTFLLKKHVSICSGYKETGVMKPLIPDNKAFFAFNLSVEKPSNAVMTLEDAQATLKSLDVEGDQDKQEPCMDSNSNEQTSAATLESKMSSENMNDLSKTENQVAIIDKENKEERENGFRILNSYQIYPCRECNINFDSKNSMDCHVRSFHKKTSNAMAPLKVQLKHDASENAQLTVNTNSYLSPNGLNFPHQNSDSTELIPSPNGNPVNGGMTSRCNAVDRLVVKENKCPFKTPCPPVIHTNPYPYSARMDFSANLRAVPPKRFYRNAQEAFYSHPFKGPMIPNHRKYINYPGEYPNFMYKHSLPSPPSHILNTKGCSDTFSKNRNFLPSSHYSQVQHRIHQEITSIESLTKNMNLRNFPRIPRVRPQTRIDFSEYTKANTAPASSMTSPTRDEVVDVLKPLSPKSMDKSAEPSESRKKYTKSEVASKMTRLADTLGRKFGPHFKRNAVNVSPLK